MVSDAFLLKTYSTSLLGAENGGERDTTALDSVTSVYLVEPYRRNSSVIKYSGTLGVAHASDQRTTTMGAFAHFVVENTACQYSFADIQGE